MGYTIHRIIEIDEKNIIKTLLYEFLPLSKNITNKITGKVKNKIFNNNASNTGISPSHLVHLIPYVNYTSFCRIVSYQISGNPLYTSVITIESRIKQVVHIPINSMSIELVLPYVPIYQIDPKNILCFGSSSQEEILKKWICK